MNVKDFPWVFLDLDETIIHTRYSLKPFSEQRENEFVFKLSGYWYGTILRECANDLINFCRSQSCVMILTASTSDYAKLICDHFELGFDDNEIIARDDYVTYEMVEFFGLSGYEVPIAKDCINYTNSILIDNQTPDLPNAKIKLAYLGINEDRYIVFPEWDGENEPDNFLHELNTIRHKIKLLIDEIKHEKRTII